jgi:hypothetical protein
MQSRVSYCMQQSIIVLSLFTTACSAMNELIYAANKVVGHLMRQLSVSAWIESDSSLD